MKAEVLKRSYDAKLAALKETAAKKDADNRQLWEARFNVMQRIRASAQARLVLPQMLKFGCI